LSVTVSVPVKNPADGGVNITVTLQLAPGTREEGQLFAVTAKFALAEIEEIARVLCPTFSSVVVSGGLATLMAELPKFNAVCRKAPRGSVRPVP
jgi:hypothetical protein